MYICICRKVNDRTIRQAIESGANNRIALANALDVGTCCGKCNPQLDEMVDDYYTQQKTGRAALMPAMFMPEAR